MSTALQLLADYYESVIRCEEIYIEFISGLGPNKTKSGQQSGSVATEETISLKKQIEQLVSDSVKQRQEIEKLRELNKTQRAVLESKLETAKKQVARATGSANAGGARADDGGAAQEEGGAGFHLLSPLRRGGRRASGGGAGARAGLRLALDAGNETIFDGADEDTEAVLGVEAVAGAGVRAREVGRALRCTGERDVGGSDGQPHRKKRKLRRQPVEKAVDEGDEGAGGRLKSTR
ncbi:AER329Cp [Eremothecium gossypii ATCC 10895]|uniref:AER329Cp n=1 Tax=Eremothecium gossypii (strain ATCC 10895 / CBS 109.51 / FGSC 9923 / NRRL Y-1056) TaxID=284811 RepID=Q756D8_EREGS|nr:AER329Cp [Eremothecium gossypii ATCC 10895]AAS53009.2 AER329Cp [Eremothecium gossypii ATCC 10895]AEY97317.1 FAER329Cp [Eremothecium gossypii FDAG1]